MMGIIKSTLSQGNFTDVPVKKRAPTADNLLQHITPIQYLTKFNKTEVNVNLRSISDFNIATQENLASKFDTLSVSASIFKVTLEWSGFMRLIIKGNVFVGRHGIEFLPFIDLNPNDISTIFYNVNVRDK